MQRRQFLKNSSLAAAAIGLGNTAALGAPTKKIGLQLWSVRDDMAKDAAGTLAALAKAGYKNVEGFGLDMGLIFGKPVKEFRKLLDSLGLAMPSCHNGITPDLFGADGKPNDLFKKRLDDAAAIGAKYLIHPYLGNDERNAEFLKKLTGRLNEGGAAAQKAGIRVGYHNHDFEFVGKVADGRLIYEFLLHETDPSFVAFEMDLYWVAFANHNPIDWLKLYPGRFRLFHVKDMAATEKRETIEVGDGVIGFQKIFDTARSMGIEYYMVELEHYKTTPVDGVGRALKGIKKLRL